MELVTPGLGLIFWSGTLFLIVLVILRIVAWPTITAALEAREKSIEEALDAAEKAKAEMARLNQDNKLLLQEAQSEREKILAAAKTAADQAIAAAKEKATVEYDRIVEDARETIKSETNAAMADVKNQVAELSLEIAEKLLRNRLEDRESQKKLVQTFLEETKLN